MPKPSSTHIVDRFIEQKLRLVSPGGALPSVRRVMDACRVGPQTVTEAVRLFEKRRLIDVRPQRGLFRSAEAHQVPGIETVDILYLNAEPHIRAMVQGVAEVDGSFHGQLIASLLDVAEHRGLTLRMHAYPEGGSDADLIDRVAADASSRACMTVGLTENSLLRSLNAAHLSVVNVFPASFQLPANSITTDADEVIGKQFDALYRRGHRRIGYLHNVEDHHPHREILLRREAFYRKAVAAGVTLLPGYVAFAGFAADSQRRAADAVLSLPQPPTGLICADQHLPAVYEVTSNKGLMVGRTLSVVGTDDKPVAREVDPPATSLQVPREAVVQEAFDLLNEISHGKKLPPADCIRASVKIIRRQSVGSAPKA
ncbi:MAG: substrate-binding domain-containing protein [Planctomycetota bacterium]